MFSLSECNAFYVVQIHNMFFCSGNSVVMYHLFFAIKNHTFVVNPFSAVPHLLVASD